MNTKTLRIIIISAVLAIVLIIGFSSMRNNKIDDAYTEYKCDVKNLNMATTIEISKGSEKFAKVSGNILTFATDPLTMYDFDGNKMAYAGDAYHFVAQDSHSVYVDGEYTIEMVGKVDMFGETYDIYNIDKEMIANAEFNDPNTYGTIYDSEGTLIAEYTSNYIYNDFTVRISDKCNIDHKSVLMIFCSYYSDQAADR
jgi:hypothetical protein